MDKNPGLPNMRVVFKICSSGPEMNVPRLKIRTDLIGEPAEPKSVLYYLHYTVPNWDRPLGGVPNRGGQCSKVAMQFISDDSANKQMAARTRG